MVPIYSIFYVMIFVSTAMSGSVADLERGFCFFSIPNPLARGKIFIMEKFFVYRRLENKTEKQ